MLGQLPWAAPVVAEPVAGVVVDELPLSVLAELSELVEDELELSLVCACATCATIAPPPTMAPARPTDSKPLRIHFCMMHHLLSGWLVRSHPTRRALRDL
jgi:hypothetical protein